MDSIDHATLELNEMLRRRREDLQIRQAPAPPPVKEAIAGTLEKNFARSTPIEDRRRLRDDIKRAVNDPSMHESIAGRAADLVVQHDVPMDRLLGCLRELEEAKRSKRGVDSAGAWFFSKVSALASEYGLDFKTLSKKD